MLLYVQYVRKCSLYRLFLLHIAYHDEWLVEITQCQTQLFAGLVGIIPKARNLRLLLLVLEFYSSLVDVKDTSPTYPDVL